MALLVDTIVGVRHLSPAGAVHLETILERVQPTCVLVEAPAGVEPEVRHLAHAETRPPVAILAFSRTRPLRTLILPLASYSPEWVACRWAIARGVELAFIDLPAAVFLALDERQAARRPDRLARFAEAAGGPDLETWWEQAFEHTTDENAYVGAAFALGEGLRAMEADDPSGDRDNDLREAFMRRAIRAALARGHAPARSVVVCGAYHAPALTDDAAAMTDPELAALPRVDAVTTLMPYSYQRLHARSGYGAGNHAPRYYQQLHAALSAGHPEQLAARFTARVARQARKRGLPRSTAQIIDAVRLAGGLAAIAGRPAITLADLRDAAVACLGGGELGPIAEALDQAETGDAVGRLPPGVSRTALQDDFRQQIEALKLGRYLVESRQTLELDLRENRYAKSESAAFLDRHRSIFLHRLRACELPLAEPAAAPVAGATSWKERWLISWSPELEVRLAELSLQGDTVAEVVSLLLSAQLDTCADAGAAAKVLETAATCDLVDALETARARVQAAAVDDDSLVSLAGATASLLAVTRFGGLRAVDPAPLWPLVDQIVLRAALLLPAAVACDDAARPGLADAMRTLARAAAEEPTRLPLETLEGAFAAVAESDAGNPYLAGLATSILLERMRVDDQTLAASIGRRLSPGEDVDLAAGFFEGLTSHNRMALFSRQTVWEALSRYVDALDGRELLRALVPLRRTFGGFAPGELRRVVGALSALWDGGQAAALATSLEVGLSSDEASALNAQLGDLEDLDL